MTRERFFEILEAEGMQIDSGLDKESFWSTRPKWVDEEQAESKLSAMLREIIDTAFVYNVSRPEPFGRKRNEDVKTENYTRVNDWLNDGLEIEFNHETVATCDHSVPKPTLCKHCHSIKERSEDIGPFVRYWIECTIPRVVAIDSEAGMIRKYACLDCLIEQANAH